jgi:predicted O-methyltransferase YrrM
MVGQLPRLACRRDPTSRAVAKALRTTAVGRIPREEREWIGRIEARRRQLAADETGVAPGFQPGAKGRSATWLASIEEPVPIWAIARMFSVPPAWGVFQLRLARELAPASCIELGTGLGLSTAYQAAALELNAAGTLATLEGAQGWAAIAAEGLSALGLAQRAEVRLGPIDDTLPDVARQMAPIDYAFLDADHSQEATLEHFEVILPHLSPRAVVLLDDITRDDEMRRAWRAISRRNYVSTSLPLGRMGVVVIR